MHIWPVPNSYSKKLPDSGAAGSFWEERKDRHHCGIDIYAPLNSDVLAIENGRVVETGVFTSPLTLPYWNETYYIVLQNESGLFCKYAEIDDFFVNEGQRVKAGKIIGKVACVLNLEKIDNTSPEYIKSLQRKKFSSMLHFELYRVWPVQFEKYLGGNSFIGQKPKNLLDPAEYLKKLF